MFATVLLAKALLIILYVHYESNITSFPSRIFGVHILIFTPNGKFMLLLSLSLKM